MEQNERKIIHIDMDCFYAAIEIRDKPELAYRPVAVGGSASNRGVLCTANYIARKAGVHSAMSTARALELCPELVVLPVDMDKYVAESAAIHEIFQRYTHIIEPLSLDEAFLDVTESSKLHGSATRIASEIRNAISHERQLTASAGIAGNKFLAKIGSDWHKPNGQCVIPPQKVDYFMKKLPVEKIFGVGKVTHQKLNGLGIKTCQDLQQWPEDALTREFGRFGNSLYQRCRGIDNRPVEVRRTRKSVSVENTFTHDLIETDACLAAIEQLHRDLKRRLKKHNQRQIKSIFLKLKFNDFSITSAQTQALSFDLKLFELLFKQKALPLEKPVRLIGLGVHLEPQNAFTGSQLELELELGDPISA